MSTALGSIPLLTALVLVGHVRAESIGFVERYALSENRQALLDELIPGTVEYYYYHALHYQVTGQFDRAEAIVTEWQNDKSARGSELLTSIRDRQRLLTFGASPDRTIDYLRNRLNVKLNHSPPPERGERRYPSQFDSSRLDLDRLIEESLRSDQRLTQQGLRRLAVRFRNEQPVDLGVNLRWLLEQVDGPWLPELDQLVIAELKQRQPQTRRFGDVAAHQQLTLDELQRVAADVASIRFDDAMVREMLLRLRPSPDEDMSQQRDVLEQYLQRADAYVQTLPPNYNSLKAAILYRRLEVSRQRGEYDLELFLRYLRLPRQSPIWLPPIGRASNVVRANLNEDFMPLALVPAIHDEQPLVRDYLQHFLRDADSTATFDSLLRPDYLARTFAEAKLLAGKGDPQQWYPMLDPATRQRLKERVELTLAPTNPRYFDPQETSALVVDVKNIDELVVRIYEINTAAYYREHNQRLDTDVDLDGLIATYERRLNFSFPDVQLHRERIELPELEGRGEWIVDLLGGGLRTRALIRRGDLDYVLVNRGGGVQISAVDESGNLVKDATLLLSGQQWHANDAGQIHLPPADRETERQAVLFGPQLAIPIQFTHPAESYQLNARMQVDRQQLLAGRMADVVIRTQFIATDSLADPSLLKNVTATLTVSNREGVETTRKFSDLQLGSAGETVVSFRVPAGLRRLRLTLNAEVQPLSTGRTETLSSADAWLANGTDDASTVYDGYLTRDGSDWILEVRGKNGEPIAGAAVDVLVQPTVRQKVVQQTLQTDGEGRLQLGALPNASRISWNIAGHQRSRDLIVDNATWPARIHATANTSVDIPQVTASDSKETYRLMEWRENRPFAERSDRLKLADGQVRATLAAGNYQLRHLPSGRTLAIAITEGKVIADVAIGQSRHLETRRRDNVGIKEVEEADEEIVVKVADAMAYTRVHVLASRYLPRVPLVDQLRLQSQPLSVRRVHRAAAGYVSDLALGEEYQYVLRRQFAKKYPGVMLPQPSLLLNPWETEVTENKSQQPAEGATPPASAPADALERERLQEAATKEEQGVAKTPVYDFLPLGSVLLPNLQPDDDGIVRIPRKLLHDNAIVQIVVCNPETSVGRAYFRQLPSLQPEDLRLAEALPADQPLMLRRGLVIAGPDKPLDRSQLAGSHYQVYSNVAELIELYVSLEGQAFGGRDVGGQRGLADFRQLGTWHTLSDEEKYDFYGRFASHELHLFLHRYDRPFFEEVVLPYLGNKKEKQFIDHWLLGDDLSAWTEPWRLEQLNAAEKALLARRHEDVREAIVRQFREHLAIHEPSPTLVRSLLEAGLRGRSLSRLGRQLGQATNGVAAPGVDFDATVGGILEGRGGMGGYGDASVEMRAEMSDELMFGLAELEASTPQLQQKKESLNAGRFFAYGDFAAKRLYQNLDATKEWAESHWYHVRPVNARGTLIPVNSFWLDVAKGDALSSNLLFPTESLHSALVAIAFSGLPLEAEAVTIDDDQENPYEPKQPVAVVTKRLVPLQSDDSQSTLLIGQRFEPVEASNDDGTVQIAPAEYVAGMAYRGQIILSNPTPRKQMVDVLWQVPEGSLPVGGNQATDNRQIEIDPFAVAKIDYLFYFPQSGTFTYYPVSVAIDDRVVARGPAHEFHVVDEPTTRDRQSWPEIARRGSVEEITAFLQDANLRKIDLSLVAHRMKERNVYDAVLHILDANLLWDAALYGYALHHRDTQRVEAFLSQQASFVQSVGPVLRSPLLDVDPIERHFYEHLEYAPLVRGRIHALREQPEILNDKLMQQYRALMNVLAHQRAIEPSQQLALTYYLLIQNRITEALESFGRVDRAEAGMELQYDYLAAYLAMHRGDVGAAGEIASRHQDHPVPRWRERFAGILEQLKHQSELASDGRLVSAVEEAVPENAADLAVLDRERRQAASAAEQPSLTVSVEGDRLRLSHRNAEEATLKFYGVDLELLFSKTPFVREDLRRMAMVRPMQTQTLRFGEPSGVATFPLPDALSRQTLLVEAVSGPVRSTTLYYGGRLTTYVSEAFGQLQVSDARQDDPVSGAYVKVYARHRDGSIRFYKDGYTDLRGRFDYASLSTPDLETTTQFAILVLDPERGATLHQVEPPTR